MSKTRTVSAALALWRRLPVIVRALIAGMVILRIGVTITTLPVLANLHYLTSIPWSPVATILLLIPIWIYLGGRGWPAATSEARRHALRGDALSPAMWRAAMLAGVPAMAGAIALRLLLPRLFTMPTPSLGIDVTTLPRVTVWGAIAAAAISAGVIEEIVFRGYIQRPIEDRHGLALAIGISGLAFWVAHLNHGWLGWTHLPFHLAVSIALGTLAYLTSSIRPAIVLHVAGDLLLIPIYAFKAPGFAWSALTRGTIWKTGLDIEAVTLILVVVASTVVSIAAYRRLARVAAGRRDSLEIGSGAAPGTDAASEAIA